jgi:hypothetical protein
LTFAVRNRDLSAIPSHKNRSAELGTLSVNRLLVQQTVPASVGILVMSLYMIVDTIFVGRWVGPLAIGAITVVMPITVLISSTGMAIGIDKGEVFSRVTKDAELTLQQGDTLLLYTDGINEATDSKELMFGETRIEQSLAKNAALDPGVIIENLLTEIDQFVGGQRSLDDITLIAVQKTA